MNIYLHEQEVGVGVVLKSSQPVPKHKDETENMPTSSIHLVYQVSLNFRKTSIKLLKNHFCFWLRQELFYQLHLIFNFSDILISEQ